MLQPFSFPAVCYFLLIVAFNCKLSAGDVGLPSNDNLIDLSWPYNNETQQFPKFRSFEMKTVMNGIQEFGGNKIWIQAEEIAMAVHSGTHMDAPCHFKQGKWTIDEIPIEHLLNRPLVVIDVTEEVDNDVDYEVAQKDIDRWEEENGNIPEGAVIIIRTGWSKHHGDKLGYLGTTGKEVTNLHYPGLGPAVASWICANRLVVGIGIEGASLDRGMSLEFLSHQIVSDRNMFIIENLGPNLEKLPPVGAKVSLFPMKLEGASGAPCRVIADLSFALCCQSCYLLITAMLGILFALFM